MHRATRSGGRWRSSGGVPSSSSARWLERQVTARRRSFVQGRSGVRRMHRDVGAKHGPPDRIVAQIDDVFSRRYELESRCGLDEAHVLEDEEMIAIAGQRPGVAKKPLLEQLCVA